MNNINEIVSSGTCIGCMACISACPYGMFDVRNSVNGFPVPIASDKCSNCGNCLALCPMSDDFSDEND